ncbi:MAG: sporulation protein YabP [Clostridia bacterium]|nr:sporulation protein YabP [Clostridia bacterium]
MEENIRKSHNIIVEDRKKFTLTGVKDVLSFDENAIMLETALGKLSVKGEELKLGQFDTQKGDVSGSGKIYALVYTTDDVGGGFFSRLFK